MICGALFVYRIEDGSKIVFECELSEGHKGLHMNWTNPTDENAYCLSWKKDWSDEKVKLKAGHGGRT